MEDLKIIEPIKNGLHHFKTTDEFSIYYTKHKNEMNEMTTQKLNKLFKIEGYRITKINTHDENGKIRQRGEICLKRINVLTNEHKLIDSTNENELTQLINNNKLMNEEIVKINQRLDALTQIINKIIDTLNAE